MLFLIPRRIPRGFGLLCTLLLAAAASAQGRFVINGKLKVDGASLDGCRMVIFKDGEKFRTVSADLNRFSLELDLGHDYLLSFEKSGFVTKKLLFNTQVPAQGAQGSFTPFEFVVSLFKQYDGVNTVVFNQPVGRIRYDQAKLDFDYDTDYTKSIQSDLEKAQAAVEAKQKEEAKTAAETAKQKERADKEKAKSDIRAAKEAEAKAKEDIKAKEAEAKAKEAAKAKEPAATVSTTPPPPPKSVPPPAVVEAPKPVKKPRAEPAVRHTATLPDPRVGVEERKVTKPRIMEERSPVAPAVARESHEPRPKFDPVPPGVSRQQDVIIGPDQVVTVVRVQRGDLITEYRKVIRKYSGTYYFKDGTSCTRLTYENEALAENR